MFIDWLVKRKTFVKTIYKLWLAFRLNLNEWRENNESTKFRH